MSQGIYWLLTIPHAHFTPFLPESVAYIRGQLEQGGDTGYLHWQILAVFKSKCRLRHVKSIFGDALHAELSKSKAADDYVWKEDTRVDGTQFELGRRAIKRNSDTDWDACRELAKQGKLDDLPGDLFIRHYANLRRISSDYSAPVAMEREVKVYWGATGLGKSRRAWEEAGTKAYPKDPRTKFWDGYRGHEHVVMDEFRGDIDIAHLLRWFDRYPVIVEIKCSSVVLCATKIWITSNLSPDDWYPNVDPATKLALRRRLVVTHFDAL